MLTGFLMIALTAGQPIVPVNCGLQPLTPLGCNGSATPHLRPNRPVRLAI